MDSIKINSLEIENVKRIKAVKINPSKDGLTILGGNNNQGKTSVLDSIAWALGGDKYRPSEAARKGSVVPPNLHIVMSNGLIVERKGKNSSLKVTDPEGNKGGQQLLNEFVEQLALDLPKFMESSGKEKAQTLLKIIGVGDQLSELEQKETEQFNQRHAIGQIADQKEKFAKEQPYYPDAPNELVSPSALIKEQQEILARNGKNEEFRKNATKLEEDYIKLDAEISELQQKLQEKLERQEVLAESLAAAKKTVSELRDESTAELESSIANIEEINRKVRANLDKNKAEEDAKEYREQYNALTVQIADTRKAKTDLLQSAELPLPELSVSEGELIYKGQKWDNMSGSDRLKVSTAIVRKLNPKCGFVLLDKLEQMDMQTLNEFGQWLEQEGLQAIATRVSTGDECSIIIEDGYVKGQELLSEETTENNVQAAAQTQSWKAGEF
jgi:DNA repair exonuclease SbcCD ATPase subunit